MTATAPATFPTGSLEECRTALVLFAAGFGGIQDARFIADAGLRATCVDIRIKPLLAMRAAYPDDWDYIIYDAFDFPSHTRKMWDVVTVDVYSGGFERAAEMIGDWCDVARRVVVLGTGTDTPLTVPDGWSLTARVHRSDYKGGVYWAVIERQ